MATRAKAAKKQVKAPSKTKKATARKSPARILMPSGIEDGGKKKATAKKSPARILLPSGATDEGNKKKAAAKKSPARRLKSGK
ncbi:hypothetical protein [Archangium lansingense]|uniref:Uncharacterized protein n=1 Tax=Archangium lansingense TaxID=2995310 RepID=A0ABT4ABB0_9BACT|nr:hypothetical protein [Archangium lansinium]MCY1078953.1 hypothetical protein [Archangium lansinium]